MHRMPLRVTFFLMWATVFQPNAAPGQAPVPIGSEFQVNAYTTGSQAIADVAAFSDGEFVIVWDSAGGDVDDDGRSVQAQRFDAAGGLVGGQFRVNAITTDGQYYPAIEALPDDSFVVVWQSPDASDYGIFSRRFSAIDTPLGSELQVNTSTTEYQYRADIAIRPDQSFLVVWQTGPSSGESESIHGRFFDSMGAAVGDDFQVNTYTTTGYQARPRADDFTDGSFIVTWESYGSAGSDATSASVQARRIAADGSPQGAQFQVNTFTTNNQYRPSLRRLADDSMLVAYSSNQSMMAQRLDSAGAFVGAELLLGSFATSRSFNSAVELLTDGSFVVAWDSDGSPGDDSSFRSIQAQRFTTDGSALGTQFQVNQVTTSTQATPAVASLPDGAFVVAWRTETSSGTDTSQGSIAARVFGIDSDSDTVADAADNCPDDSNPSQDDADSDAVGDVCDNCPAVANTNQDNADGDGFGDACDTCTDTDGDGFGDPGFPANTCAEDTCQGFDDNVDADSDTVPDGCDNCSADANTDQENADGDGFGDACDSCTDTDGDGFGDPGFPANTCAEDTCQGFDDSADADADGVPDGCDVCAGFDDTQDGDLDGVPDGCDVCAGFDDTQDADADGVPDGCDVCAGFDDTQDGDLDGVPDGCDVCAGFDDTQDGDLDGVPDGCDVCAGFDDTQDGDLDGVPDGCDVCAGFDDTQDADADGVPDGCDVCAGFDDTQDGDLDGVPDGCDVCAGFDDTQDGDLDGVPDGCDVCAGFDDTLRRRPGRRARRLRRLRRLRRHPRRRRRHRA